MLVLRMAFLRVDSSIFRAIFTQTSRSSEEFVSVTDSFIEFGLSEVFAAAKSIEDDLNALLVGVAVGSSSAGFACLLVSTTGLAARSEEVEEEISAV